MEENLFLCVYEKRKKIFYLNRKFPTGKNTVICNLSSCVIERYDRYEVVKIEQKNNIRKHFRLLDFVYEPVDNPNRIIESYFTEKIHIVYRLKYSRGEKMETLHANECYSCHKFHSAKIAFEKHLVNCTQSAGIVYKIDNKSCEDFGDMSFVIYFDFETSAGTDLFQDKKIYVLSYCIIIAFHPTLDIERIVVFCIFQQNQDRLVDLSHLKEQRLQFVEPVTLNQLKDTCLKVYNKECLFGLSEMFSAELKFTVELLIKWFHQTYKSRFLEIDALTRQKKYEKK